MHPLGIVTLVFGDISMRHHQILIELQKVEFSPPDSLVFSFDTLLSTIQQLTGSSPGSRNSANARGTDLREALWGILTRLVFAEPDQTVQKKVVALGLLTGMTLLVLWTVFGQRV